MIPFVVFSIRRAWQGFWRNAIMSLAATATMILMLLLLSGFFVIQTGLRAGIEFVQQKVEVVADLKDGTSDLVGTGVQRRIEALPEVASVEYVTAEEALRRFRETLALRGEADLTRSLDKNPLRASIQVKLRNPNDFGEVMQQLRAEPAVQDVKDIEKIVERVQTVTGILQSAGAIILAGIGLIVLFIVVNTIRLAVLARAEEIEIMRLVGASDAFIRWPFVFEGAIVGLLGAAVTLGALAAAADPVGRFMFDFFRVLPLEFGSLARDLVALVVGAGLGLGILGSWISVRTYLIR